MVPGLMEGVRVLHGCAEGPTAAAAWAPHRASAFCDLIEEHGITRNNVRPSYPILDTGQLS